MSKELNENTSQSVEKIETTGGDAISFDDLERIGSATVVPDKTEGEIVKKPKAEKEVTDEEEQDEEKKSKKKGEDEDESSEKTSKEKSSEKEEVKKKGDVKSEKKVIKVKSGESLLDLDPDAIIEVPVNGKKEGFTVQELINEFSGKTDWNRKYTALDKEKKSFEADKTRLTTTMKEFYTLMHEKKDPLAAINYLGENSGYDMAEFWRSFKETVTPMFEERAKLSPEERRIKDMEEDVAFYKQKEQTLKQKQETQKVLEETRQKVSKLMEKSGISEDQFYNLYTELKESGIVKPEDLTPELVVEYHKELEARSGISSLLKDIGFEGNEEKAINDLRGVWVKNPDLTLEEIREIAVEAFGSQKAKVLSKKLQKSQPAKNYTTQKTNEGFPVSFDDLE